MSALVIYKELHKALTPTALREVIVAHENIKCTRQSLKEWCSALGMARKVNSLFADIKDWLSVESWRILEHAIRRYGFGFAIGTRRISNNLDQGKGGWSNLVRVSDIASANDDAYIYLAPSDSIANTFRIADESGEDSRVALHLGIPNCCSEFFSLVWPAAARHQGDLCTYSCAMSEEHDYPWDWHTNIVGQYFGGSVISFFPCSFHCANARSTGIKAFSILSSVNRDWAESVRGLSKGVFVYTEYGGVHRWSEYKIIGKQILLSGKVKSTIYDDTMCNARAIEYLTPHDMILRTDSQSFHLSGADVALFIF
jgi:hypothetical protein